jgi:hypothetical protein
MTIVRIVSAQLPLSKSICDGERMEKWKFGIGKRAEKILLTSD